LLKKEQSGGIAHKSLGSMKITFSGSRVVQAPLSSWIRG